MFVGSRTDPRMILHGMQVDQHVDGCCATHSRGVYLAAAYRGRSQVKALLDRSVGF